MQESINRFYAKYRLYTVTLPALITAVLVGVSGWLAFKVPAGDYAKTVEIVFGGALPILCAGAYEMLSRVGFRQLGLDRSRVRLSEADADRLKATLARLPEVGAEIKPAVADLGAIPLLMADRSYAWQVWLSEHTLHSLSDDGISCMLLQVRAEITADSLIDRVLIAGGYWWANVLAMMLLVDNPQIIATWLAVASVVFVLITGARTAGIRSAADRAAAKLAGQQQYGAALAGFLVERYGSLDAPQAQSRLRRAALSDRNVAR